MRHGKELLVEGSREGAVASGVGNDVVEKVSVEEEIVESRPVEWMVEKTVGQMSTPPNQDYGREPLETNLE